MNVTTYCINKGQPSQFFGLKNADENYVLSYAPNNWKTEQGAIRWAKKHGYEVVKPGATPSSAKAKMKTKYACGVVVRGQSYIETVSGDLVSPLISRNVRTYSRKDAAMRNAERIADRFPRSDKAKPFVSAIRVDV